MPTPSSDEKRQAKLIAAAERARARIEVCEGVTSNARAAYRDALRKASEGGVSKSHLARLFNTGESRIREDIKASQAAN